MVAWKTQSYIPFMNPDPALIQKLSGLEGYLASKIRGQGHVIPRVCSVLERGELGLQPPEKPLGSFLFLGPTGVGKTELTLECSRYLFGDGSLHRFDMSEFQHLDSVKLFLGDETRMNGRLGKVLEANSRGILLFDEVEKAHPDVVNILLKIMDEGSIVDNFNRKIDFSNTIIVLTGNIGAEFETSRSMGFVERKNSDIRNSEYTASIKKQFKPELISRIDEILIFNNKFSKQGLNRMIQTSLNEIQNSLLERNIILNCQEQMKEFLYELVSKESNNARNIQKILRNKFELPLCEYIVSHENISEISIKVVDNNIIFN
jgi:ATP-dependent Clp protease ATP-binding subunit ClpC